MDPWYLENLVCPVDKQPLSLEDGALVSRGGRRYAIVDGLPVMLVQGMEQTIGVASSSLAYVQEDSGDPRTRHLYLETLGISESEKEELVRQVGRGGARIDPVVAFLVGATSGHAYGHLIGKLTEYPIPELRLPPSHGIPLLDMGCNWGRWSIAAVRKGYSVTGVDPSLGAVMAARRVARHFGLPLRLVVADGRYLPFRDSSYGVVFSYSVLQHLSRTNVVGVLAEVRRVLQRGGQSLIQMPNWLGARSFYHLARRNFREGQNFEVRYWSIRELKQVFEAQVGPSTVAVDCYFGLGLQKSDQHLMRPALKLAVEISERLRALSRNFGGLKYLADSVYVQSLKADR